MEEQSENTCDLCKISYASETELKDHVWSLMHHIKIEQRKKGCAHTCSLCLTSCENIIEYGKHLNEDKHKHALSRKNKDPNSPDILNSFGQSDMLGKGQFNSSSSRPYEREPEFREPDPVQSRKPWMRSARNQNRGGHSRSYSEPEIDTDFHQEYGNEGGNRYFNGNSKNWKNRHSDYEPPGYSGSDYEGWGYEGQWGRGDWNGSQGEGFWNWGAPAGYGGQFGFHALYTPFENTGSFGGQGANWRYGNARTFKDLPQNSFNRRGSFDDSFHHRRGHNFSDQERRGRGLVRGSERGGNVGFQGRGESKDRSSPDSNSSNDSNGLKRRRDDDHELSNGKLRKGNSNKRIMEAPRPLTPGDDFVDDSVENLLTDNSNQRQSSLRSRNSSQDRLAESLPARMETRTSKRTPVRSTERPKQVTWASDMVSSTTDIDNDQKVEKHDKSHRRSSSLDSATKRNKLPDSTSNKKVEKKSISVKEVGKVKSKGKSRQAGTSPVSVKRSPRRAKDEGESVLEKAEKLCKKLRDEREKGKKEKLLKEKQKKLEKHKELNSQIKELTEKNKAKIKGHLEAAENMIEKNISEEFDTPKMVTAKHVGVLEKAAVSLGISVQSNDGLKGSDSTNYSKHSGKKGKPDIERIRETIENSVRTDMGERLGQSVLSESKSEVHSSQKPESGSPTFPSPLAKHMLSKQKSDSSNTGNYDTDHLLKMVNSPRSTKERLQIAQMLRTYAKSKTKLSLPRFNLKMSDLCSGSGDRQDEIAELNLEQMSPDMQLEIASLIEADVKPDISELEKLLDFQSAANVMLDSGVLSDLGIMAPERERTSVRPASPVVRTESSVVRTGSPVVRTGSPIVFPSSSHKQFSSSVPVSDTGRLKNISAPIKQEPDLIDFTENNSTEIFSPQSVEQILSPIRNRSVSPVITRHTNDIRPSLSMEDLATGVSGTRENYVRSPLLNNSLSRTSQYKSISGNLRGANIHFDSSRSLKEIPKTNTIKPTFETGPDGILNIKEEKVVPGYEKAEAMNIDSYSLHSPDMTTGTSPVRNNKFSSLNKDQNVSDEMPVRDTGNTLSKDSRTALEKVKSILDEAPNMETVLDYQQGNTSQPEGQNRVQSQLVKDAVLDISHGSQSSSVLDQVYSISLQEEVVRQELSVVNGKITQLQKLIDEAMQQMKKFTDRKDLLLKQEDQMRSSRMKLLQDSRSQSSVGSQPEAQYQSSLAHLTDAQLHNLSNPVFIKFLMSQRNQSDMSSIGGFSNVETGSQGTRTGPIPWMSSELTQIGSGLWLLWQQIISSPEPEAHKIDGGPNASRNGSRRGSFTSNITEPVSLPADRTLTPRNDDETSLRAEEDEKFLTQSVDLLSGSAPSVRSSNINSNRPVNNRVHEQSLPNSNMEKDTLNQSSSKNRSDSIMNSQNSFSLLNNPISKGGFVTLEDLMGQTSDIGKLLQRSLDASEKPKNSESRVEKQDTLEEVEDKSQFMSENDQNIHVAERERRNSLMSSGSDDLVISGSDIEKLSGKVSMKYMGTIPDNVNYTEFMKQIASDSKTKSVMYTVVTSPDAVSQLKKFSDSGLGTGSLSSQGLAQPDIADKRLSNEVKDPGYKSEGSVKSTTTGTLTIGDMDFESQSVKSTYSLGEQIKRMCEGQNPDTPRSEGDKAFKNEQEMEKTFTAINKGNAPPQSPSRKMLQNEFTRQETAKSSKIQTTGSHHDLSPGEMSPTRKKLKTKKERDRKSRRKQKEEFILESSSDTNSVDEEPLSLKSKMILRQPSLPEEDMLVTGSEDGKKTKPGDQSEQIIKKSLLDDVQLETETPSDSCDDKTKRQTQDDVQRLKMRPEVLESFRSAVKTKLQGGKSVNQPNPVIQYKGPSLSVAAIQVFKDDLYVCYSGSELRRFNLKTGEILKELDCTPYLVQCLLVTSVDEREDILYTGGACKKLMLFKPQKFNLIETYDYDERINCLHENWGRLFVGLSDGVVSVRSMKTDKELNLFQTTNKSVLCLSSTSAGMTKMLCCGCADKIVYVLDAISGLLLTMLQGHQLPPLCIEIFDDMVVSGAADKAVLVHNVRSGSLETTLKDHKAMVSQITSDKDFIYTACYDKLIRCYSKQDFILQRVFYGSGKGLLTSVIHHDGKLMTGNKEGLVESFSLSSSCWKCKCEGCKLQFALQEHLLHHVLSDHLLPNSRMLQCPWSGCSQWLSTVDGSQKAEEHIMTEHFK